MEPRPKAQLEIRTSRALQPRPRVRLQPGRGRRLDRALPRRIGEVRAAVQ